MLNVPLLRRVQQSILSSAHNFDMNLWCSCIAGHIVRESQLLTGIPLDKDAWLEQPGSYAARLAGISYEEAIVLFSGKYFAFLVGPEARQEAADLIGELIAQHEHETTAPPQLRGKPRLKTGGSRARQETRQERQQEHPVLVQEQEASAYWHGLPPTVRVDFSVIPQQAREEEPELVGV